MSISKSQNTIKQAFDLETQPKNSGIIDCTCCPELSTELGDFSWQTLPPEHIRRHRNDLPILTDEAYRYYLPAFLCLALEPEEKELREFLYLNLSKPSSRDKHFNKQQILAIVSYLLEIKINYLDELHETDRDFEDTHKHWKRLAEQSAPVSPSDGRNNQSRHKIQPFDQQNHRY